MDMKTQVIFELPEEKEIESVEESRVATSPGMIQKTIRYKNGMIATLVKDFHESIYSIQLSASEAFCMNRNQVLRVS
jgi:hypothetical protein